MKLRNSTEEYGLVSRVLHWTIAAGLLGMIVLGTRIAAMEPSLSNLWLYGVHKSIGLSLFALVLIRVLWHLASPVPKPFGTPGTWQMRVARMVHGLLYVTMIAIPLSGWAASSATGIDTVVFGTLVVPSIAPPSEAISTWGFAVHGALWKALVLLLVLHIAGAFSHGLGRGGALRRMISGS